MLSKMRLLCVNEQVNIPIMTAVESKLFQKHKVCFPFSVAEFNIPSSSVLFVFPLAGCKCITCSRRDWQND
jgi:hypothetical protein